MRIKWEYECKASAVLGTKLMHNECFLHALVNSQSNRGILNNKSHHLSYAIHMPNKCKGSHLIFYLVCKTWL